MSLAVKPNTTSPEPLPLFRPEALAARQNPQGKPLRIRPFSWVFLCWLAIALAGAAALYFFFFVAEAR